VIEIRTKLIPAAKLSEETAPPTAEFEQRPPDRQIVRRQRL
jgi:hypothetical protein